MHAFIRWMIQQNHQIQSTAIPAQQRIIRVISEQKLTETNENSYIQRWRMRLQKWEFLK